MPGSTSRFTRTNVLRRSISTYPRDRRPWRPPRVSEGCEVPISRRPGRPAVGLSIAHFLEARSAHPRTDRPFRGHAEPARGRPPRRRGAGGLSALHQGRPANESDSSRRPRRVESRFVVPRALYLLRLLPGDVLGYRNPWGVYRWGRLCSWK